MISPTLHCPCDGAMRREICRYDAPPKGETRFRVAEAAYRRAYDLCTICGHLFGRHDIDLRSLYDRDYVDATYGGSDGMRARFERIMALPADRSDNHARVARIAEFAGGRSGIARPPCLLDVGAGLGVFPAAMRELGWEVLALEPDERTIAHLKQVAMVEALGEDLLKLDVSSVGRFDAVTFNKVLEHVEDPAALLVAARGLLKPDGFVYLEVPDAIAAREGFGREEFFIEHHHVFSPGSFVQLAEVAGFDLVTLERIREPSTKFTLRGFLAPRQRSQEAPTI